MLLYGGDRELLGPKHLCLEHRPKHTTFMPAARLTLLSTFIDTTFDCPARPKKKYETNKKWTKNCRTDLIGKCSELKPMFQNDFNNKLY